MAVGWETIEETMFVDPSGTETSVRLFKQIDQDEEYYELDREGRDLALLAYKFLGGANQFMDILELNAGALAEHGFDVSGLKTVRMPVS